ncbi:unannotated protein [freshwater metagenome]|uniref:Unannotated protein n=1 Tax=freshwater metagenome TaxID=449393 RepID=A0A6J6HM79_9ZZZZ
MNTVHSSPTCCQRRNRRVPAAIVALVSGLALLGSTACSSTSNSDESLSPDSSTITQDRPDMRGERYCEVLLVSVETGEPVATVFNSYPLNDCPETLWSQLDAQTIAAANNASLALLNGPRFWLMNDAQKANATPLPQTEFGGIAMYRQASVNIGSLANRSVPYIPYAVDRSALFTYNTGERVYLLTAPDGATYVMQTWSAQKDPGLTEAALTDLGTRLSLPAGWMYSSRILSEPLVVDTRSAPATVLQDNFENSYSKTTGG